jgi:sporulation protein YlmC with PRC-barrel domain
MNCKFLLTGAMVLSLGTVPFTYAADPKSDQDRFTQQMGSEMGVPDPGSISSDQETTKKQRDPSKHQRAYQNAQVTLGGAKYVVHGGIRNIQGDYYFINDEESGDEVRLLVNNDTNLDCSAAQAPTQDASSSQVVATDRLSAEQHGREASDRQKEQGQNKDETAVGSGFRIGTCSFKPGDRIKAEVDDMGRVTTLRFMPNNNGGAEPQIARSAGETAGTGELAIPGKQDKPGQLDMTGAQGYPPKQYALLPIPMGKFVTVGEHSLLNSPVYAPNGTIVGSLETLIMDSETGQIEYAVVLVNETNQLEVAPWARFRVQRDTNEKRLVLNTKQYQLSPSITAKDMADGSPDQEQLAKAMESTRAPADLRDEEGGIKTSVAKNKPSPDMCANKNCHVIRGRVSKLEGESFMVKEKSGKEVSMTVDRKTQKGQVGTGGRDEEFSVGDTVEAYVTSTGHAESISLMRPNSAGRPEEIGG